ncbi:MAG: deoxyribonuclease IV [bacterium]|nr:deoxyribonuclease IV [bacterium]
MSKSNNPIGAHFSVSKGYLESFKVALSIGAEAMQIFAKSPMQAKLRAVTYDEAKAVRDFPERAKIKSLVIHASYLMNFAKKIPEGSYEIKSLVEDVFNSEALGGIGAVAHLGKSLEMTKEEAINNYVENIKKVVEKTDGLKSSVILENTAGQGTEIGFNLEELGQIYKKIGNKKRVKFCLDTAHMFGAGYDMRDAKSVKKTLAEIDKFLGVENIACIHFNDSKKALGSHVDRHEDVGHGQIGEEGLKNFITELRKAGGENIPLILETPEGFDTYEKQIKKVRSWF